MPRFIQNISTMLERKRQIRNFKPYVINRNIHGTDFSFYIADEVGKEWYDTGDTEWREMDYLKDTFLEAGDVILECGAHHGVTTSYLARCIGPKGKIVSFEPSAFNCKVIKKNLKLNKLSNVTVENKAIGEEPGTARFSYVSNSSIQPSTIGTFPVEITTIDSYAKLKPTVLKIDVEGYDVEALRGAKKVLATRPKLAIEIHTDQLPNQNHTYKDVFDLLDLTDYDCVVMEPKGFKPLNKIRKITTNIHLFAIPNELKKKSDSKKLNKKTTA